MCATQSKLRLRSVWYKGPMSTSEALPEFRRAAPEDAFDVARRLFRQGERVDMATLAEQLGIGRTTLYRWVGDREQLMGRVVVAAIAATWADARANARGKGQERTLDSVRRFIAAVSADLDLRGFVQREPSLALRVLMDPEGTVARTLQAGLGSALAQDAAGTDRGAEVGDEILAVTIQVATSLVWANVAGSLEPRADSITDVLRKVLRP